jgi:predicted transcriptional regulator
MPWRFLFDPSQPGLRKVLREHEELALRYFWDEKVKDVSSRDVWIYVNEMLGEGKSISKTTIVNFLSGIAEEGVLSSKNVSGRGGYRDLYSQKMNEKDYQKHIIKTILESLMRDFPEETNEVLKQLINK